MRNYLETVIRRKKRIERDIMFSCCKTFVFMLLLSALITLGLMVTADHDSSPPSDKIFMSWTNAWHSIISWAGGDSSNIDRVSSFFNTRKNTIPHPSLQSADIDVVYTWVNGSDPVLIDGLLAARADLRKSNVSRDAIIESWQEVNKCHTANTGGYFFLEVPIGFVEPRVSDFARSLLDAKQLDDGVFITSSPKGSLLYFKNIDQLRKAATLPVTVGESTFYSTFLKLKCSNQIEGDGTSTIFNSNNNNKGNQNSVQALLPLSPASSTTSSLNAKASGGLSDLTRYKKVVSNSLIWVSTKNGSHSSNFDRFVIDIFIDKKQRNALISLISALHASPVVSKALRTKHYDVTNPVELIVGDSYFFNLLFDPIAEEIAAKRFADNDELKYSLRSLEKYAPWFRNVYIVTNGQIPIWLDTSNPRLKIVTHNDIFLNKSHLPTFSSPAIECHLHRIPGLSRKFIYINDDVILGAPVWPEDFYTNSKGAKVYLTYAVPSCEPNCPSNWIKDGFCDKACNTSSCQWDGGDCLNVGKQPQAARFGGIGGNAYNKNSLGGHYSGLGRRLPTWSQQGPLCSPSCSNSWLGDQFCDRVCNNRECAYDFADCGLEQFTIDLEQVHVTRNASSYHVELSTTSLYMNLSKLYYEANKDVIVSAVFERNDHVRSMGLNSKYKILTILLFDRNRNETTVTIELKIRRANVIDLQKIVLNIVRATNKTSTSNDTTISPSSKQSMFVNFDHSTTISNAFVESQLSSEILLESLFDGQNVWPRVLNASELVNSKLKSEVLKRKLSKVLPSGQPNGYNVTVTTTMPAMTQTVLASQPYNIHTSISTAGINIEHMHLNNSSDSSSSHSNSTTNNVYQGSDYRPLAWERRRLLHDIEQRLAASEIYGISEDDEELAKSQNAAARRKFKRHLTDVYADSLRHVNRLYNIAFGTTGRKVPAHMPLSIDTSIVERMHNKFPDEFDATSSHRVRSSLDMQFAFSYFYFLLSESESINASTIVDQFDTDNSGFYSTGELRSLMVSLVELPLQREQVISFIGRLEECSQQRILILDESTFSFKVEQDISKRALFSCSNLTQQIEKHYTHRKVNKYEIVAADETSFKMLRSNASLVMKELDESRKYPKKFMCFNDDMDPTNSETVKVRALLKEYYETLVPKRSQFELPPNQFNPFADVWQKQSIDDANYRLAISRLSFMLLAACIALLILTFKAQCYGPIVLWLRQTRLRDLDKDWVSTPK